MKQNEKDRKKIQSDVEDYISGGGSIEEVDHTANEGFKAPIKRAWADQVRWVKRNKKIRRGR